MTDAEMMPAVSFDKLVPPIVTLDTPDVVYVVQGEEPDGYLVNLGVYSNETDARQRAREHGTCYVQRWELDGPMLTEEYFGEVVN